MLELPPSRVALRCICLLHFSTALRRKERRLLHIKIMLYFYTQDCIFGDISPRVTRNVTRV